ncbi:hypothetical protein RHSIM_Rhsim05G0217600 [Rhododendron simsii]|uniref:AAA+ ATPase domain-containing protein n=1 Tax=Rhododendron simsii TaxID=118357 RepID=A0A834H1I2_RHOSS|nr:hypothetical protein RHSIM_Rhsim05G0217600 [Rhododendron simsii]
MQRKRRKSELKMCNPTIVLDKIVEKIVGIAFESVGRHLGYLLNYKKNIKNLDVEMKKLQEQREIIEGQIDEAKTSGEIIIKNVSNWLNEGDGLRQGVETFMDQKTVKENVQCFKYSCPDFISRYRLSKEAEKKMGDVKSLAQKANFDTISLPKPPPPELQFPSSGEYVSFDSRASAFNMIMDALKDSKVNVIGVYGAGGVGKTTMVEKVGEQVKKDGLFDEVVMAVVSQDAKVAKIQGVLADRLNLKLEAELTEVGRANKLWNRLKNEKRNLIILDDIWKKLDLKEIGIPITDGKQGCKVVLTSRNQRVLIDMDVHKDFPIQVLSEEEAWNLFKKKMGNNVESHDQLHDIAKAVCRECRGLPVGILAVGAALKGKSMFAWKSSLDKLQKSMLNKIEDIDPKLFTSLRLSYDYLDSADAKSCFLLCCLFPEDAQIPIEELARHCMARRLLDQNPNTLEEARDIVCSVVNTLKTSCLLLDVNNDDFVKMHDIVRDIAILIAKEERAFLVKHGVEEWPETGTYEKYSAISLRSETISELPDELVCPELHTLMLECSSSIFQRELSIKIPDRFFRGAEKLMVLELSRITVLPLPSSLGQLTELRMLCLNECKLGDIAILKCLKNKLEVLRLGDSDIKALPHEVGELTRLRLLDLGHCQKLDVIPNGVISKLYRLEELHFPRSFENWEGTTSNEEISKVSVDELMSLTRLSTLAIHIPNHRLLPKDLGFQNLIRFNITVGSTEYYDSKDYSSVVLRGIYIDDDFNILESLLGKPGRGGQYPSRSFNNLTKLLLEDCRLKYLFSPSCARGLLQLQRLQIRRSMIMEAVIGNEGETDEEIIENVITFSQLKSLHLDRLPHLISFYPRIKMATTIESHSFPPTLSLFNEKVAFPALEELNISSVQNITEIWHKKLQPEESFCRLKSLEVSNCAKLMNVITSNMLPQLKSIETRHIYGCPEMEVIVDFEKREEETQNATNYKDMIIVQFPQLRILTLDGLGRLSSFSNTSTITDTRPLFNCQVLMFHFSLQVAFPALEELSIKSVQNITEIWHKKLQPEESFCRLKSLEVSNCEKLMNVVPSNMLPQLKSIETLDIYGCPEMEVIVDFEKRVEETQNATNYKDMIIVQFPQLRILKLCALGRLSSFNNISTITETRPLFNCQVAFPALEKLKINYVQNITEIWHKKLQPEESFCRLKSLEVSNCEKLMNVVPSNMLPQLKSIETLDIFGCPEMEVIVDFEKREEETQNATNYKDMIIVQVAFPALEKLNISSVQNITEIWHKKLQPEESFCRLKSLEVSNCEKLMNVVPSNMLPQLKSIETLDIYGCPKMEVIVDFEKREEETQNATNYKDMIIVQFPQLRILKLCALGRLSSFNNISTITETRPLFNYQVAFPALEKLKINYVQNITEIWHKKLQPEESFCRLKSLEVSNCAKLMNVVPSNMLPQLKSIETLDIYGCPKMEVIVDFEKREEETQNATNYKDMIIVQFPQLRILTLDRLGRLSSFSNTSTITDTRPLFNCQVAFPALEKLKINYVQNITEIWHKKLQPEESFCRLKSLEVRNCEKLMNVVPSNMLPQLKSIETLDIFGCPEMEVIVDFEKKEEKTTQEATNKDMIIVQFPQLRILKLFELGRLSSFNNTSTITETRPLFNYQVAFPALEELNIKSVQNITEIWHKKLQPEESFCRLKSLEVSNCGKLMNVVPSNMLPQLKSIETLYIYGCPEMEVIVDFEKREEETQNATNYKDMIIVQVAFPALEELFISSVPNITEIWDKNLLQPEFSSLSRSLGIRGVEKLKSFKVKGCEKLMNVVPSHMLPLLKSIETLEVSGCPEMEVIVVLEKREEETQEATNKDMIIVLPVLRSLKLLNLENLKGICAFKSNDRLCFNVQVAFPALEELIISSVLNITEIWDNNLLQPESFCLPRSLGIQGCEKLRSLKVKGCEKLMNMVPSHMLPLLKSIETLEVSKCPEMEVIVVLEEKEKETQEATNKDIIVFPELTSLTLKKLKNLKGVCAYKFEDRLCFNVQVAFPALEELSIDKLPNITKIWDKNLLQPESFCLLRSSGVRGYEKLRSLNVKNCKKLINVVPSHMLPLLKKIQTLGVFNCPEMEVIVVLEKRDEETREAANNDTIILFPELELLIIQGLENLKGVCAYKSEGRLCFNVQVEFPKLSAIDLRDGLDDAFRLKIVTEATSRRQECATTDASRMLRFMLHHNDPVVI